MTTPLLSVVIPAYNEAACLERNLLRLRQALGRLPALAGSYEIIVCDNNSRDNTADIARRLGCRVVFEPVNQIGRARNRGAAVARGCWLLFLDADSWPPPDLIGDVYPLLHDDDYIGCGSTIHVEDGPRWWKAVWQGKNWSMRAFEWCPGGFLLCRREAFKAVEGFSEELYIFEELDFIKRLKVLATQRDQRFVILHRHPFHTSGRKGSAHGPVYWLSFALRYSLAPGRRARSKRFAAPWYER